MSAEHSTTSPAGPRSSSPITSPIQLLDHTKEASDAEQPPDQPPPATENEDDDAQRNKSIASQSSPLSPKSTRVSVTLREEISRRKWAKYQEDRTATHKRKRSAGSPPATPGDSSSGQANACAPEDDEGAGASVEDTWGESTVQRRSRQARERARVLLPKLHTEHHSNHPDFIGRAERRSAEKRRDQEAIDVLYENQRGWFAFGLPLFSSRSLLQCDPPAWVDREFRPAGFDIRDAQVPDPGWRWEWKTWYVDMSRDVDEEGWEYSFAFRKKAAWHGNHPWHLSFVRRRRWLRKRVKDHARIETAEKAHALNPDYFTIHSRKRQERRPVSPSSEGMASQGRSTAPPTSAAWGAKDWKEQQDEEFSEIASIPALMKALRKASIDREKILYVTRFLDQGGEELYYLAEEMGEIMRLFVFQNSRRQLLALLMHRFEDAKEHRDEHEKRGEEEGEKEQKYIDNLLRAVEAADEQCKKLEFWSDFKNVEGEGEALHTQEHDEKWGHDWQGAGSGGATSPPKEPVDAGEDAKEEPAVDKGKGRAEVGSDESEVAPEQMLKRQNTPGVWPSSSEKETSRETQASEESHESQDSEQTTFHVPEENQPPTLSQNLGRTAEKSSESGDAVKPERDVSRMGEMRVSDSNEEHDGTPSLEHMLRRRSTPGVWIDGAKDERSTGEEVDVGAMDPTSEQAKAEHEGQHEAMGSSEALGHEGTSEAGSREEEQSKEEDEEYGGEDEGEYEQEEGEERPFKPHKSAEAQVAENLAKLQAEREKKGEKGEGVQGDEQGEDDKNGKEPKDDEHGDSAA